MLRHISTFINLYKKKEYEKFILLYISVDAGSVGLLVRGQ